MRIGTLGTLNGTQFIWDGSKWFASGNTTELGWPANPAMKVTPLRVHGLLVRVDSSGHREYLTERGVSCVCWEHGRWQWRPDAHTSWMDARDEEDALAAYNSRG